MRTTLIFLLIYGWFPLNAQLPERIEPPNWWVGMKDEKFQILLYGKEIGKKKVTLTSKRVKLLRSTATDNPNYLFLDIWVHPSCKPGNIEFVLSQAGKESTVISYPLLQRNPDSASRTGYSSRDVVYLITPDRFSNGESTNDSITGMGEGVNRNDKNGRHGGDLLGIQNHLDYIKDLGFTSVWITPMLENNMPKTSYHGYAITDFYKMDPRMGTNETYKSFCQVAHEKGLKVIMDLVLNHCGSEHWWMKDLPDHQWINYIDQPYIETNHRKTLQPDPYGAPGDLATLDKGWFVPTMPDLNGAFNLQSKYLITNTLWWIEYAGIDGIRMDTYLYPDQQFMAQWSKAVMNAYPNFNITGEVWYDQPAVLAYWQKGKINTNGYTSSLPSLFDFPVAFNLVKAINAPESWDDGWVKLYETIALDFVYPDPMQMMLLADNHDMSRIYAQLNEDVRKVKLAMALILTTRGIPQIYYGTEVLMNSPKTRDDGLVRSDFPGGWSGDKVNAFTGEGLTDEQKEMQLYLKTILNWRKKTPAVQTGKMIHYVPEHAVYVYFRYDENQKVMIILNKNEKPISLKLERFAAMIGTSHAADDIITGKPIALKNEISLEPMKAMILELN